MEPRLGAGPLARWVWVILGWAVTRAWLLAAGTFTLPFYPGGPLAFNDLDVYADWVPVLQSGALPTDEMWQYPPFSAFVFVLGAAGDPRVLLQLLIVAVDLALTVLLFRRSPGAGWAWVAAGLLIGPVLVSRFDVFPTVFAVLAVLAAGRPQAVGAWAAVGAALKVWPVLVLAIVPRRDAVRAGTAFLAVTVALLAATALSFDRLGGFLGGQGSRGLQVESVAALPFMLANAAGLPVDTAYRYGSMEVAATGAGAAAAVTTIGLLLAFAWLARCWWRGVLASHEPADVAFTAVVISVVFSRVFSPQYSVWLLALGALCLAAPGSRMRAPVAMVAAATALAQLLYPWGYGSYLEGEPGFVAVQAARVVLVVAAAALALARISRQPTTFAARMPRSASPVAADRP